MAIITNALELVRTLRRRQREFEADGQPLRTVFTNGAFDLLHVGHLRYLRQARAMGELLIVGLNSDESVRGYKDPRRPLVPQDERAELLAALDCVDYVVIFNETTASKLIEMFKPTIYVKGGDYALDAGAGKPLPELAAVAAYGGEVRIVPLVQGHSTSGLVQTILERYSNEATA